MFSEENSYIPGVWNTILAVFLLGLFWLIYMPIHLSEVSPPHKSPPTALIRLALRFG